MCLYAVRLYLAVCLFYQLHGVVMQIHAETPEQYLRQLPEQRQWALEKLRECILANLPDGFAETMSYGMIGYVVPHSVYPKGYHCDTALPLPFISIASQKNFVAVYHMGIYAHKPLMDWFTAEHPKYCTTKLDMGKSCIRFKKIDAIPFELIGKLAGKMSADEWIGVYEQQLQR